MSQNSTLKKIFLIIFKCEIHFSLLCVQNTGSKLDLAQDHWCSNVTYESYSLSLCLKFQSELCLCFHLNSILVFAGSGRNLQPYCKILQARLQQYMNWELPDVKAGFKKGRETRDQIANIHWIIEKAREFQKNICFIDYSNTFDCVGHNKLENS